MTRATQFGIASLVLLGASFVLPFWDMQMPLSSSASGASCILAIVAAWKGSKWWLVVPGTVAVEAVFIVLMMIYPE